MVLKSGNFELIKCKNLQVYVQHVYKKNKRISKNTTIQNNSYKLYILIKNDFYIYSTINSLELHEYTKEIS